MPKDKSQAKPDRTRQFLDRVARLEAVLRRISDQKTARGLGELVNTAVDLNRAVAQNQRFLRDVADLRNAIVHNPYKEDQPIAKPHKWVSDELEWVTRLIDKPPRLLPDFAVDVATRRLSDRVSEIIQDMWIGRFSQIPVYSDDNEFAELVTTETIARWLSQQPTTGPIDLETPVTDLLPYTEDPDHFAFVSTDATVLEALDRFEDFARRGKYLDALLVTRRGAANRLPEAILTQHDLPKLYEQLRK